MQLFNVLLYAFIASLPFDYDDYKIYEILTPTEFIGFLLISASLVHFIMNKKIKLQLLQFTFVSVMYFVLVLICSFSILLNGISPNMKNLLQIWSQFLIFLSLLVLINTNAKLKYLIAIFFIIGFTIACLNIIQYFAILPFELGRIEFSRVSFLNCRVSSINPIFAISGFFSLLSLILAVDILVRTNSLLGRFFYVMFIMFIVLGIIINQSRSILVAFLVSLLAYSIVNIFKRSKLMFWTLSVVIILICFGFIDNLEKIFYEFIFLQKGTVFSRVNQYYYVYDILASSNILNLMIGYGPEMYRLLSPDDKALHNTFLDILLSYGIIGISIFSILTVSLILSLIKSIKTTHKYNYSVSFLCITIGLIISMNGYSALSSYVFSVVYAVSLITTRISNGPKQFLYKFRKYDGTSSC